MTNGIGDTRRSSSNQRVDASDGLNPLHAWWDALKEAGLSGREIDVGCVLDAAGICDAAERSIGDEVYRAARQAHLIERGAPPASYDPYGAALEQRRDPWLDRTNHELKEQIAPHDRAATFAPGKRKSEGATSAEFDAALKQLASGEEAPSAEEIARIGAAQDAALAKKGVPEGNRRAIGALLDHAAGMHEHLGEPEQFGAHRDAYLEALNDKQMWWTVSPTELKQFRSTLAALEARQANGGALPRDRQLDREVDDQRRQTRIERERPRRRSRKASPARAPTATPPSVMLRQPVDREFLLTREGVQNFLARRRGER